MSDNETAVEFPDTARRSPNDMKYHSRFQRWLAELPWKPSSEWYGNLLMLPLALMFAVYWGSRKLFQHASGIAGILLLVAIVGGLREIDMFAGVDLWIVVAVASVAGLLAVIILFDWYRERLQFTGLFRRPADPRQDIARRRFHLACEQVSFAPSAWHAGYDNDMFGIGVEFYLRRLMIWKHGRAYVFALDACQFAHRGHELFVRVAQASPEGVPEVYQFRLSCVGGKRSPGDWVRLLKRATHRQLTQRPVGRPS